MLKKDLHVHLYGCLTAEDLWKIGKENYKKQMPLLNWYADEYKNAWGRRPNVCQYWESENGFTLLEQDYVFAERNPFPRFQANFNLIIALCPIRNDRFDIQEKIIRNVDAHGLEYFEARTLVPAKFTKTEVEKYLYGLCQKITKLNAELDMQTRLVFSLFRDNAAALKSYKHIRSFIEAYPDMAKVISGLDFAFTEEGFPPKSKESLFKEFHRDNKEGKKLDLLYHVGESFQDKGIISAIRWIWEADQLGATRLGHAIALGVDPANYKGKIVHEPCEERLDSIHWLIANKQILREHGHCVNQVELSSEEKTINKQTAPFVKIKYDDAYIEEAKSLQKAVATILKKNGVLIESCPTSNLRIGQVEKLQFHPLKLFHELGLNYAICTDDPGIFAIDWHTEQKLADQICKPQAI